MAESANGEPELCTKCGHPFDPHLLVATRVDPAEGGIMICDEDGCTCLSTWALGDAPPRAPALDQLYEVLGIDARVEVDVTAAIADLRARVRAR